MSSIIKVGKGKRIRREIAVCVDGKRPRIRLGVVTQKDAERFERRVDMLVKCKTLGQVPEPELCAWLTALPDKTHRRLSQLGLVEPRIPKSRSPKLSEFVERSIAQRVSTLKPNTIRLLRQTQRRLTRYFTDDPLVEELTANRAADWRAWLAAERPSGKALAEATVRLHCRNAKSIFKEAVARELIGQSPFRNLRSAAVAADRSHYVTTADAERILAELPGLQWRVLFALARYAGLRCPSETHTLQWGHINWDRRRLTVYAPKTDQTRTVPIVQALFTLLQDAFEAAEPGTVSVVGLSRNNMPRTLQEAIKRAGLTVWPDLFQTLRRSCETELAQTHPQHAVSAWMGHGMKVSEKHYLQLTDDALDRAAGVNGRGVGARSKSASESASVQGGNGS